jgi:YVTN family beta-propeller protein
VVNESSNNVTVIDGATNTTTTVAAGTNPAFVAVNPVTNKAYVANGDGTVTVIDGMTDMPTATVTAGTGPISVAVNPVTNKIYVANNGSNDVTVIDGATNATANVSAGSGPNSIAVNSVTNKIYVANKNCISLPCGPGTVTVIDGATNATANVSAGTNPVSVAVNPVTNKVYVANNGSNNVTVIDGATNATANVSAGTNPVSVAVNSVTNKIYVASSGSNDVTVIDGATNMPTATVAVGTGPNSIAVNPVTNKIYVTNSSFSVGAVTVIDGATNTTTTVANELGPGTQAVAVNPVTNKVYAATVNANVMVIDGATNTTTTVATGSASFSVAVNPVTNKIYVPKQGGNIVTVMTEQQVQAIRLTTTISTLPNNQTTSPTPSFTFTASNTFSPTAPAVDAVYFQLDTWQGAWTPANPAGTPGSFTATLPTLSPGIHILYAYSTDAQDASSIQTGGDGFGQSSPLIGNIAAYLFLFAPPPPTDFSLSPISPITVSTGGPASSSVTVNSINGPSPQVTLSVPASPAGLSASFTTNPVTPPSGGSASSALNVSAGPSVTPSTFTLTVTGTFGSLTHSTTVAVTITADSSSITNVIGNLLSAGCVDNSGIGNALTSKLSAAQAAISTGDIQTAINILTALKSQLQAQSSKHIFTSCAIGDVTFNPVTVLLIDVQSLLDSLKVGITPNPVTGYVVNSSGLGLSGATVSILSAGNPVATATTDITGFYFFPTTGVLSPGSTYTVAVVALPAGFTTSTPAFQTFLWGGTATMLSNFLLS